MANIRIKDLSTDSALSAGDYVVVDSASEGSRKFDLGTELANLKEDIGDLDDLETTEKSNLVAAINEARGTGGGGDGLTGDIKEALLLIASKVAYADEDGEGYYQELYDALYPPIHPTAIELNTDNLSFAALGSSQQLTATVTPNNTTDEVTWTSSDSLVASVSETGLVTSVAYGSALITANCYDKSASCSVVIAQATLSSISAVYTQSGTVYDTASLDDLKADLVVTGHWSDSSTSTIPSTDYVLSGTLAEGTSTITVSYGGKTTTFTVTVTHYVPLTETISWTGTGTDNTSTLIDATQHDVYITIPFHSGDSRYGADATAGGNCVKERAYLYENSDGTGFVGYWYVDTQTIETGSRTVANRPWLLFDTETKIAPKGYYVKWMFSKSGSIFGSNANCRDYLNEYATTVTLK